LYEQLLLIQQRAGVPEDADHAEVLGALGRLYLGRRDHDRAEPVLARCLEVQRRGHRGDPPAGGAAPQARAGGDPARQDFRRCAEHLEPALGFFARYADPATPTYAGLLMQLGLVYMQMRDYARAEPRMVEGVRRMAETAGEENLPYTSCLNNLGML